MPAKSATEEWKKTPLKIGLGATKKLLGAKGACESDRIWLCAYVQNKVAGECLPPSLYSNECMSIMARLYGPKLEAELERIRSDWKAQNGLTHEASEHS